MTVPFEQRLFQLLICPESKAGLVWYDGELVSTDADTRRAYPVEADVPIMLLERSRVLDQATWQRAMDEGQHPEPVA